MTLRTSARVRSLCGAAALLALTGSAPAIDASPPPPATLPSTRPADPAVAALVAKLADADPAVRDAATAALRKLGRDALPALTEAADSDDPEMARRAKTLVRQAHRRLPPAPPVAAAGRASTSVSVSVVNGARVVDVDDNGYRVKISQGSGGITMDVTGVEDGKPATATFAAKDAEQLRRETPEAFALYEKYAGGGNGVRAAIGGARAFGQGNAAGGNLGPAGPADAAAARRIAEVLRQVEAQIDQGNFPPAERQRILEMLRRMQERPGVVAPPPAPPAERPPADGHDRAVQDVEARRERDLAAKRQPMREE